MTGVTAPSQVQREEYNKRKLEIRSGRLEGWPQVSPVAGT